MTPDDKEQKRRNRTVADWQKRQNSGWNFNTAKYSAIKTVLYELEAKVIREKEIKKRLKFWAKYYFKIFEELEEEILGR